MTESTKKTVAEVLDYMGDLKDNFDITLRVSKNGYCAAYLNEVTPRGKTLRKQVEWDTSTPEKAEEFLGALEDACMEESAFNEAN